MKLDRKAAIATLVLLGWEPVCWHSSGGQRYLVCPGWTMAEHGVVRAVWYEKVEGGAASGWVRTAAVIPVPWACFQEYELAALLDKIQELAT